MPLYCTVLRIIHVTVIDTSANSRFSTRKGVLNHGKQKVMNCKAWFSKVTMQFYCGDLTIFAIVRKIGMCPR